MRIVNPFAGWKVSWTWADHLAHINPATGKHYQGGTDYAVPPGRAITSPADGVAYAVADGLNGIAVVLADGRSITIREAATRTGKFPRKVKLGEQLGVTGRLGTKYPHIEAEVHGVRVPFGPLITTETASSGASTPITEEDELMAAADDIHAWIVRENRARLYRNQTTGRLVAINWNLPTGDPGKVAYFDNEGQAANAAATYQYVGDTVAQAKVIPDGQPWTSLLSLAHGTDSVYRPK